MGTVPSEARPAVDDGRTTRAAIDDVTGGLVTLSITPAGALTVYKAGASSTAQVALGALSGYSID